MSWKKGNRVKLRAESDAAESTREIYEEIKHALGLPHVAALHKAFAVYPEFFQIHWQAFHPLLATNQFFEIANRLRADAYTRAFNYFEIPDLSAAVDQNSQRELEEATDQLQYEDPVLLLIAAIQLQAFDGLVGRRENPVGPANHPVYARSPRVADEEQASPPLLRQVYADLRHALGTSYLSYEYHVLGQCPGFLAQYWTALKEWLASPMYEGAQQSIRESAWTLAREIPHPVELTVGQLSDAGIRDEDIASVVHIGELFVDELSSLVLNMSLARIALEGGSSLPAGAASSASKAGSDAEKAA